MTWEGYWLPNLVNLLVFGVLGSVLSTVVVIIVRRAFRKLETTANDAKTSADDAATSAGTAATHAEGALGHSREATEALVWLATELGKANERGDSLANHADNLLGQLVRQRIAHPEDFPTVTGVVEPDPDAVITGKHRLPTQAIRTIQQETP